MLYRVGKRYADVKEFAQELPKINRKPKKNGEENSFFGEDCKTQAITNMQNIAAYSLKQAVHLNCLSPLVHYAFSLGYPNRQRNLNRTRKR